MSSAGCSNDWLYLVQPISAVIHFAERKVQNQVSFGEISQKSCITHSFSFVETLPQSFQMSSCDPSSTPPTTGSISSPCCACKCASGCVCDGPCKCASGCVCCSCKCATKC